MRPVDETCRRAQVESLKSSRSAERLGVRGTGLKTKRVRPTGDEVTYLDTRWRGDYTVGRSYFLDEVVGVSASGGLFHYST